MEKDKYKKIEKIIDEIENIEVDVIEEINAPVETKNLKVKVVSHANVRQYPNHMSSRIKMLGADVEIEVLDIVEGSLVQGGNTWYKIDGGFVHSSQVKEVVDNIENTSN